MNLRFHSTGTAARITGFSPRGSSAGPSGDAAPRGRHAAGARRALTGAAVSLGLMLAAGLGQAQTIAHYAADGDPTAQGFGAWPYNGTSTTSALADDLGRQSLRITSTGSYDEQFYYTMLGGTGPFGSGGQGSGLTAAQAAAIASQGFTLSFSAYVVSGPVLAGTQGIYAGSVQVDGFNGKTYDVMLGSDGAGGTSAVLPTAHTFDRVQLSADWTGAPIDAGRGWHDYALVYDPGSNSTSFYVDGLLESTGYTGASVGENIVSQNYGLVFGAADDATVDFADVQLAIGQSAPVAAVPEPSTWLLLGGGLLIVGGARRHARTGG